ncbi:MAG: hypothetical protein AAFY60_13420, partial [Myxococcota bacterium]
EDQKKPKVANPQDVDGDGVVDGESLSGDTGRVENSNLVNLILQARGLQANDDGGIDSVDGFALTPSVASIVTDFSGVPPLPEDSSSAVGPAFEGVRQGHYDWMHGTQGVADSALMWMALSTMAKTSMRDMSDAKDFRNAMQLGKAESKKNEIKSTEEQIEAERRAAAEGLMWSIVSAVATYAFSSMESLGASQAMGKAAGDVVSAFGKYHSKAHGAQAEADDKRVEAMRHQLMQELLEQGSEVAKASYDEAREQFKLALKILDEHAEREAQITANITRG